MQVYMKSKNKLTLDLFRHSDRQHLYNLIGLSNLDRVVTFDLKHPCVCSTQSPLSTESGSGCWWLPQ